MLTKDEVYADALAKTLTKVSSPATVGLYSSCQNRITMILRHIEECTEKETLKMEQEWNKEHRRSRPRSAKLSFTGLLAVIRRLLFYMPVWTEQNQQHRNIRFIYVHFSAWHFAGSDLLWAGLVIRLFQAMEANFGKFPLALYRVVQHDEEEEIKKKTVEDVRYDWRSKKFCCFPLWFIFLSIFLATLIIVILLALFGFPETKVEDTSQEGDGSTAAQAGVVEGLAIAALGVPAWGAMRFIFLMAKNLMFNQDLNIRKGMDNEQVSNRLGFMYEVRKEMWLLTSFIQFMEVFERRRIRIVLKITNLDRCSPKKIVSVLDAINILLSDEESPFISILAVNPEVLVEKVNFADGCFSKEDRAYAFLSRIVTLPFTIPPLCDASRNAFYSLTCKSENTKMGRDEQRSKGSKKARETKTLDESSVENAEELNIPLTDKTTTYINISKDEENLIMSTFRTGENLNSYILDDAVSMRRVINSIRVTVIIMKSLEMELPSIEDIAAWIVLANHWPCRLSWIIQCLEDDLQRAEIDDGNVAIKQKTLWEIFSKSRTELFMIREEIKELLEQDSDPEMFEMFLTTHFPFKIEDLERFQRTAVNLDHTIKKELGQIRGTFRLKDSGWMRNVAPLPIRTIVNMSVDDVCEEMKRQDFADKYANIVRSNGLSGTAIVFGDVDDLKSLFQMTFGEWTNFRLHFLGFPSHLRLQNKAAQLSPTHGWNQPPRSPHHFPHHHSQTT
ncbi:NTPase KAP family P-loop domain-containing protein 1 [Polymixia lowei]